MRQTNNILKATKGNVIFRVIEPDNYFHACTMLEGETKADFGEISEEEARDAEASRVMEEL